jgi:hypothetical protein
MKLSCALLVATAVGAAGAAMAGPPPKFKTYGQCMSYYNTKYKGPQSPEKRANYCDNYKPGNDNDNSKNGKNGKNGKR